MTLLKQQRASETQKEAGNNEESKGIITYFVGGGKK